MRFPIALAAAWTALLAALLVAPPRLALAQTPRAIVLRAQDAEPYTRAIAALHSRLDGEVELDEQRLDLSDEAALARLRGEHPAVWIPVGTAATRWVLDETRDAPVVFAMVLDPARSGLVGPGTPGAGRATGAVLDIPVAEQLRALRRATDARRVAVLYDPDQTGALVRSGVDAARAAGIELVPIEVRAPHALEPALAALPEVDAIWTVPDSTVMTRSSVERLLLFSLHRRIPLYGLSEQYVRAGALLALSASYEENGRHAAALVKRVLAGESPRRIPLAPPRDVELVFNAHTAERLGLQPELPAARAVD